MNKIQIITTTSTIEGWQIQKYFGLVTHQVVIGANIFRDVFASFTDIFGGSSKGYQKDLKNMEVIAIKNLKEKASKLGANIIIGLRLDFDEISGGSKSMFMVSASGTAVLGVAQNDKLILKEENNSEITWERLSYEIEKDELEHEINSDDYIIRTKDQIKELTSYNINAIPQVINFMRKISTPLYYNDDEDSEFEPYKNILVDYFGKLPENKLNDFLKSDLFIKLKKFTSRRLLEILNIINWYNYDVLNFLLYNNSSSAHIKALYMLEFSKEIYAQTDITDLLNLSEKINHVYNQYPKIIVSKSSFGKDKEEWKCLSCGKKNPKESSVCKDGLCKANVYGIPNSSIDPFGLSIELKKEAEKLKSLLNFE